MPTHTNFFNQNVLSSFNNVRKFLSGEQAIAKIKQSAPVSLSNSTPPNWHFRWRVFLESPLRGIVYLFARSLESIFQCLHAKQAAKKCKELAERQCVIFSPDINLTVEKTHFVGMRLLNSAVNKQAPGTEDISKHPDIPLYSIQDPKVAKRLIQKNGKVEFHHDKGVCEGIACWYLYLYVATKHLFKDPRKHLIAITQLFEKGAPREAIFLQSTYVKKGKILNTKIQREFAKLRHADYVNNQAGAKRVIDDLPPGAYHVSVRSDPNIPGHSVVFIKINKTLSFFFDSNYGLYEIGGPHTSERLLPKFDHYLDKKKMNTYAINFHRFELRDPSQVPLVA